MSGEGVQCSFLSGHPLVCRGGLNLGCKVPHLPRYSQPRRLTMLITTITIIAIESMFAVTVLILTFASFTQFYSFSLLSRILQNFASSCYH